MPRTEVALHGLHHVHRGRQVHVEFQNESKGSCITTLERAMAIFDAARIEYDKGLCPPGWNAPPGLIAAMQSLKFHYIASARDVRTPIGRDAVTNMSGLGGMSLTQPTSLGSGLIHFTSNFLATSPVDRARAILDSRGILAIKGHIIKNALGYIALDGIDAVYCNYLDAIFTIVEREYGDAVWWTTMGEIARRVRSTASGA
jgi:hypothetical protein